MKTIEERLDTIKKLNAEELLKLYDVLGQSFNPLDDYYCETYELVRNAILERMGGLKNE